MHRCLIIGGNSGIGAAVAELIDGVDAVVWRPDSNELNINMPNRVRNYITLHGPFSHIVYSAGVNQLQWIRNYPNVNTLDRTFDTNVFGFLSVVSEHLNVFPSAPCSVVAVSSDAATIPMRGSLAYCASKAALDMSIKVMARELAPLWRVNGVAPGMVEGTPMTEYIDRTIPGFRGWSEEYALEYERSSVPTGRRARLDEVAGTIRWVLFGPEQLTGEIVRINGGKS